MHLLSQMENMAVSTLQVKAMYIGKMKVMQVKAQSAVGTTHRPCMDGHSLEFCNM